MLLVIDIGNSNVVLGLYQENQMIVKWRIISDIKKSPDDYAIDIIENLANNQIDILAISGVVIASVVPDLTKIISLSLKKFFSGNLLIIDEENLAKNIVTKLKNKQEIGADRLVNAIAGYNKFGGNLIIIDFGTATTFDIVGFDGEYMGGIISPGVNLAIKALHEMTAKLPLINLKKPQNVIGKSTIEAMNSGIYFGYLSLIEGIITRIEAEYKKPTTKIITGGLAVVFKDDLAKITNHHQPDLTLDGLNLIYQKTHEKSKKIIKNPC